MAVSEAPTDLEVEQTTSWARLFPSVLAQEQLVVGFHPADRKSLSTGYVCPMDKGSPVCLTIPSSPPDSGLQNHVWENTGPQDPAGAQVRIALCRHRPACWQGSLLGCCWEPEVPEEEPCVSSLAFSVLLQPVPSLVGTSAGILPQPVSSLP